MKAVRPVIVSNGITSLQIKSIGSRIFYLESILNMFNNFKWLLNFFMSENYRTNNEWYHFNKTSGDIFYLIYDITYQHLTGELTYVSLYLVILMFLNQLELIYYFTYFSTVVPSNICVFLSCRPFVVNTKFSTSCGSWNFFFLLTWAVDSWSLQHFQRLVDVEVSSVSWLGQVAVRVLNSNCQLP